jgi:hypothetical protein
MLILMKREWIDFIRKGFGIPTSITDDEINEFENRLKSLPHTSEEIRVANLIDLVQLRKRYFADMPQLGIFPSGFDLLWQGCCERMFLEGQYGPCCVWARATLQLVLHEMCLFDKYVKPEFKGQIRHSDRTPGIGECTKALGSAWTSEDEMARKTIEDNGDAVVHHNLDQIAGRKKLEEILRGWGVADENLDAPGFKANERLLLMAYRPEREREMAKSSLEALYGFLSMHKLGQTV